MGIIPCLLLSLYFILFPLVFKNKTIACIILKAKYISIDKKKSIILSYIKKELFVWEMLVIANIILSFVLTFSKLDPHTLIQAISTNNVNNIKNIYLYISSI